MAHAKNYVKIPEDLPIAISFQCHSCPDQECHAVHLLIYDEKRKPVAGFSLTVNQVEMILEVAKNIVARKTTGVH